MPMSVDGRRGHVVSLASRVAVLLYETGGAAFGSIHTKVTNTVNGATDTFDASPVGWTVGAGIEYALTNNWLIRAEYRYTDFGTRNDLDANSTAGFAGGPYTVHNHDTNDAVRAGVSCKFF
jgi:outer membrane immunogenic protein